MRPLGLESAIAEFLGTAAIAVGAPTARDAVNVIVNFYRTVPVAGAEAETSDMLLLEWGRDVAHEIDTPTDMRNTKDFDLRFEPQESVCLSIVRQVFAPTSSESEFDNDGVQMHVNCFFGPAIGEVPTSHFWIDNPAQLEKGLEQLWAESAVAGLLSERPRRIVAYVDYAG